MPLSHAVFIALNGAALVSGGMLAFADIPLNQEALCICLAVLGLYNVGLYAVTTYRS